MFFFYIYVSHIHHISIKRSQCCQFFFLPWYRCEWRMETAQMKSSRASITTNELSSILTHCTLIIIVMNLSRETPHACNTQKKNKHRYTQLTVSELICHHIEVCLPLVVKLVLCSFIYFLWVTTRVKFLSDFDAFSGRSCWITNTFSEDRSFYVCKYFKGETNSHHLSQTLVCSGPFLQLHGHFVDWLRSRRSWVQQLVSGRKNLRGK